MPLLAPLPLPDGWCVPASERTRSATFEALDETGGVTVVSGELPLHSRLDLAPLPSAVRRGRAHVEAVLTKWGLPDDVSTDAVLVVSELLTNVIRHGALPQVQGLDEGLPTEGCSLLLWYTAQGVTVAVHDADPRPPVLRSVSHEAECGRGLGLVDSVTANWGYTYPFASPDAGKLVWARLDVGQADLRAHSLVVGA